MNLSISRLLQPAFVQRALLTASVLAASLQSGEVRADAPSMQLLGPEYWDRWHEENCDQVVELRAHGISSDAPLVIPAGQELKTKVYFDSSWGDEPVQVVAFTPLVDNPRVLADFALHATPPSPGESRQVYEWFPGLPGTEAWTDQAGVAVANGSNVLMLELHYYNLGERPTQVDRSGVKLCLVRGARLRPIRMGVADLGVPGARVPGRTENHVVTRTCTARSHQPAALLSATPGMHKLGTGWKLVIEKADGTPSMTLEAPYAFGERNGWRLFPDVLVEAGDRITTSCTYSNPMKEDVESGWRSEDEVCRLSVSYYPEGALICN